MLLVWFLLISGVVQEVLAEGVGREVHWVSGCGPGRKRTRLNRRTYVNLGHVCGRD